MAFGDMLRGSIPRSEGDTQEIGRETSIQTTAEILLHHQVERAIKSRLFEQGKIDRNSQPFEVSNAISNFDPEEKKMVEQQVSEQYKNTFYEMTTCQYDLRSGKETHSLTGLANKKMTGRIFDILKEHPDFKNGSVGAAMVRMDLDGFKAINDRLGHDAGDAALKQVAEKISSALKHTRPADFAAHYSGDEFAIILTGIKTKEDEKIEDSVEGIISRIINEIENVDIPGGLKISASAGYKIVKPGDDFPSTDHDADLASGVSKNFKFVEGIESGSKRIVRAGQTEENIREKFQVSEKGLFASKIRASMTRAFSESFPNGIPDSVQVGIDITIANAVAHKFGQSKNK